MSKNKNLYPVFILFTIGGFICFLAWSAWQAGNSGSQVTDADYYSKGLRYTSTLLEKKAAEALGWEVSTQLEDHTLQFHLQNKEKQPVTSAIGTITFYLRGSSSKLALPLEEVDEGIYQLELTSELTGTINAHLEFERDGARLNRQLLLNL